MRRRTLSGLLSALALALPLASAPEHALACGGFFCASTPVDQNAERVLFKVRPDGRTDMIVQITYQGKAEDFAWVLPLAEPPSESDLGTFPQRALTALDAQSGPVLSQPCAFASADGGSAAGVDSGEFSPPRTVDVYVRAQIGNYDVAVIGSASADAAAEWLTDNGFRISDPMKGYIALYTAEGMKFLALKLLPDKTANDITPFKLTLPGTSPSIPLRLSAVAAEPEMGVVVWVLGSQRYEPANAQDLKISDDDIRFEGGFGQSNWPALVARAVDESQGRGFVTEYAESTQNLVSLLMSGFTSTPEQMEAATALGQLFDGTSYITRMYTRVSPEEMTYDPIFRASVKGDVSRYHTSTSSQCGSPSTTQTATPCDFAACGALGLCREVMVEGVATASCACAGGSTARTTFVPGASQTGFTTTVSCVDQRLSYLNPGDRNADGEALPDPCVGFDCGGHGTCVAMNMTPTCDCERGYVAVGSSDDLGNRFTTCVQPSVAVPSNFYNRRALPRDPSLPIGRELAMEPPSGSSDSADPAPDGNAMARSSGGGGGCNVGDERRAGLGALWLTALGLFGVSFLRRRRRGV